MSLGAGALIAKRRRALALSLVALTSFALAGCGASETLPAANVKSTARAASQPATTAAAPPRTHSPPTLARMLGQMIVTRFPRTRPSRALLARIREGRVGGVILFADNVSGGENQTRALVTRLQRAASERGNPPLLVMTDQEGGEVKRLPWAPPTLAPREMSSTAVARAEGEATGMALRAVGINVDLAPVADVERAAGSFLRTRAFGSDPATVGSLACQFAEGLASQGVAFTLKHFPGLGRALTSTDEQATTVEAQGTVLREDYLPYRDCGASHSALVMVSSAIYPSLSGPMPAVLSPEIYREELPLATGGSPPTISDDLQAAALAAEGATAERAINAGLDLLLYGQNEGGAAIAFGRLIELANAGGITRSRLEEADTAIQSLKGLVAGASAPPSEGTASYPESVGAPETVQPEAQAPVESTKQAEG
jgi:beta-N-acetylhexosaminidase